MTEYSQSIRIIHNPTVADNELSELKSELSRISGSISIESKVPGPQNAIDWTLPAIVTIYLGNGLLEGFLKEIGSSAAKGLKRSLIKLFNIGKKKEFAFETKSGVRRPAPVLSIKLELGDTKCTCKLVFPEELNETQFEASLDTIGSTVSKAFQSAQTKVEIESRAMLLDPVKAMDIISSEEYEALKGRMFWGYSAEKKGWITLDDEPKDISKTDDDDQD